MRIVGLVGRRALRTPNEESTTPEMTLLADPAIASTCCSTRPRKPADTAEPSILIFGSIGERVIGMGIGDKSVVLSHQEIKINN